MQNWVRRLWNFPIRNNSELAAFDLNPHARDEVQVQTAKSTSQNEGRSECECLCVVDNGGAIVSEATADRNTLSTQTFGFTDLQNHADYSATSVGFSGSTASGKGAPTGIGIPSMGPTGFGAAGTSDSASGTTYAVVSPGTITVRGDAGTGHDSTAGLSRDAANANGSVADGFNASKVQDDLAIQQAAVQVGMQVAGDVADALAKSDPAHWGSDGEGRMALHVAVAAAGAAMGGGNVAGAIGGTIAGDLASNAVGNATGNALAGNIAAGVAGAVAGGGGRWCCGRGQWGEWCAGRGFV